MALQIEIDGVLVPERWLVFAKEYLKSYRLKDSAIKAGYSTKTAHSTASTIVRNPKFKVVKAYAIREIEESAGLSKLTVLDRLKEMAEANIADFMEVRKGKVTLKNKVESTSDLPESIQRCIKGFKQTRDGVEIIMHDQMKAMELLNKMLGYQHNDQRIEMVVQRSFKDFYEDIDKKED